MPRPVIRATGRGPLALAVCVSLLPAAPVAAQSPAATSPPAATTRSSAAPAATTSSPAAPMSSAAPAATTSSPAAPMSSAAPAATTSSPAAPTTPSASPAATTSSPPAATTGPSPASTSAPQVGDIPATPRAESEPPPTFTSQDGWTTPKPGPKTSTSGQGDRRWQIRQAPLAGAESSWGPPGGQMPEYAEFVEPEPGKGAPPKGTPRIVGGAVLGVAGLGLAIAGIVGATTTMLGDNKRLSVPMIGVGIVGSAIGWGLFADGVLRRKKFLRWQARGAEVSLTPTVVPGRLAGVSLGVRF